MKRLFNTENSANYATDWQNSGIANSEKQSNPNIRIDYKVNVFALVVLVVVILSSVQFVAACTDHDDCTGDMYCVDGECFFMPCDNDNDCLDLGTCGSTSYCERYGTGQTCREDGTCTCSKDSGCETGQTCREDGTCTCSEASDCYAGQTCREGGVCTYKLCDGDYCWEDHPCPTLGSGCFDCSWDNWVYTCTEVTDREGCCKELTCNDGDDNDGDGRIDCKDYDCDGQICVGAGGYICQNNECVEGVGDGAPSGEVCNNSIDDDGNGLVDCKDPGCFGFIANWAYQDRLCDDDYEELQKCGWGDADLSGTVRNVGDLFDALCYLHPPYGTWGECNVDGMVERKGDYGVTFPNGTVINVSVPGTSVYCDYLCHEFEWAGIKYESWIGCGCKAGEGVKAKTGDVYGDNFCYEYEWLLSETNCSDGKEEGGYPDLTDCADPTCDNRDCHTEGASGSAMCEYGVCKELTCNDGFDNDGDETPSSPTSGFVLTGYAAYQQTDEDKEHSWWSKTWSKVKTVLWGRERAVVGKVTFYERDVMVLDPCIGFWCESPNRCARSLTGTTAMCCPIGECNFEPEDGTCVAETELYSESYYGLGIGDKICEGGSWVPIQRGTDCLDSNCWGEEGPNKATCCYIADDCPGESAGARCSNYECKETACRDNDNVDDDGDGLKDCLDPDCDGKVCEGEGRNAKQCRIKTGKCEAIPEAQKAPEEVKVPAIEIFSYDDVLMMLNKCKVRKAIEGKDSCKEVCQAKEIGFPTKWKEDVLTKSIKILRCTCC